MLAARAAEAVSSDIVGYNMAATAKGEWYMVGVQFTKVGGGTINALDYAQTASVPVANAMKSSKAAQLLTWDSAGEKYNTYYYLSDAIDQDAFDELFDQDALDALYDDDKEDEADELYQSWLDASSKEGWADLAGILVTSVPVAIGDAFWFVDIDAENSITICGGVESAASVPVIAGAGWTMISNGYPTGLNVGDVGLDGNVGAVLNANKATSAAQLVAWDAANEKYNTYYYLSDAIDQEKFDKLYDQDALDALYDDDKEDEADELYQSWLDASSKMGWADLAGILYTGSLQDAGKGFWFVLPAGNADATITFKNPVK